MHGVATLFQWLGGALFVAALAVCAWWFVTGVDRLPGSGGAGGFAADLALFGLFAVHHSVFARPAVKDAMRRVMPDELVRSLYVWTASLLLVLVCLLWRRVGGELYDARGGLAAVLIAVQIGGLLLVARAVRVIDPLELAGIRRPSPGAQTLQVVGPYRWVRHPIYLGWMLATFGIAAHDRATAFSFRRWRRSIWRRQCRSKSGRSLPRSASRTHDYRRAVRWRIVPFVF